MGSKAPAASPTIQAPVKSKREQLDINERKRRLAGSSSFGANILSDLAGQYGLKSATGA